MQTNEITDAANWDQLVTAHGGHPLQLWGWGEVKTAHGWSATRITVSSEAGELLGGAQILERRIPFISRTIAYVPRGPWCEIAQRVTVLTELTTYLRNHSRAISVLIEPDWQTTEGLERWKETDQNVLLASTLQLDLTQSTEVLLDDIAAKRRYDIRTSTKKLTEIRPIKSDKELQAILAIYHDTATRAGFSLHSDEYYRAIHRNLGEHSVITAAFIGTQPVAFTWYAVTPQVAFELYGGIIEAGQKQRANFGLKWYGIEHFRTQGVAVYDFNGLLNDGISNFKRNFASHETQLVGSYIMPLSPWHAIWNTIQPLAKHVARIVARVR